jgi:hypothetical protein
MPAPLRGPGPSRLAGLGKRHDRLLGAVKMIELPRMIMN